MKLGRSVVVAALLIAFSVLPAKATDRYDDSQSNPLRLAAYLVHPIGYLAEWLVTRPFHRIVSNDDLQPVFGYVPHDGFDYETYTEGLSTGVTYELPYTTIREPSAR